MQMWRVLCGVWCGEETYRACYSWAALKWLQSIDNSISNNSQRESESETSQPPPRGDRLRWRSRRSRQPRIL